jgi:hypothetical protein
MGLQHLPVRRKLALITGVTSAIALIVASLATVAVDALAYPRTIARDVDSLADMVGATGAAAVEFGDAAAAREVLAALRARPHVEAAALYALDGRRLATYERPGSRVTWPPAAVGVRVSDGRVDVIREVRLDGERIGLVHIRSDLEQLHDRIALTA